MRAFLFALTISIIVHLLVFFEIRLDKPNEPQNTDKKTIPKGSQVKYVKLKPKKKLAKKEIKKQKIPKEFKQVKKVKPLKKIIKKQPKPIPKSKKIIRAKPQVEVQPFNLNDFLNSSDINSGKNTKKDDELDNITKSYIKLYGEEFTHYSEKTKKFLRNSLASIGKITQRYLEYPYLAAYGGQSGTNVIQFFLHPDGSISDVKIKTSSGYNILDWNTKDTIEKAYRDYPRPEEKTKIIIYVNYILK